MFQEIPKNCRYAYIRVSFKSQEENSSLEEPKQEFIHQDVPKQNLRIEVGAPANAIHNRPIFQKLIEDELKEN